MHGTMEVFVGRRESVEGWRTENHQVPALEGN